MGAAGLSGAERGLTSDFLRMALGEKGRRPRRTLAASRAYQRLLPGTGAGAAAAASTASLAATAGMPLTRRRCDRGVVGDLRGPRGERQLAHHTARRAARPPRARR